MQITPDTLPDHHFLFIAPNLGAAWIFQAARTYWERYQPTIISDGALLELVPPDETVIVSLLTQRDAFRVSAVAIAQAREDAFLDALVYESPQEAALALDNRVALNQPFGVPLTPTQAPPTRQPLTPTLGSILDQPSQPTPTPTVPANTSGFITQTPSPAPGGNLITQTPSPTPEADDDTTDPLNPTPGAIIGGN